MVTDYRAALRAEGSGARFRRPGGEGACALGPGTLDGALTWARTVPERLVTRAEVAALADEVLDPFALKPVDHRGRFAE